MLSSEEEVSEEITKSSEAAGKKGANDEPCQEPASEDVEVEDDLHLLHCVDICATLFTSSWGTVQRKKGMGALPGFLTFLG